MKRPLVAESIMMKKIKQLSIFIVMITMTSEFAFSTGYIDPGVYGMDLFMPNGPTYGGQQAGGGSCNGYMGVGTGSGTDLCMQYAYCQGPQAFQSCISQWEQGYFQGPNDDCVSCGQSGSGTNIFDFGIAAVLGIAPAVSQIWTAKIGANAYRDVAQINADAQQGYYDALQQFPIECTNQIDLFLQRDTALAVNTNISTEGFQNLQEGCSSILGQFAGFGGQTGTGLGGFGNGYLGAGYTPGFLGGMLGPNFGAGGFYGGIGGGYGGFYGGADLGSLLTLGALNGDVDTGTLLALGLLGGGGINIGGSIGVGGGVPGIGYPGAGVGIGVGAGIPGIGYPGAGVGIGVGAGCGISPCPGGGGVVGPCAIGMGGGCNGSIYGPYGPYGNIGLNGGANLNVQLPNLASLIPNVSLNASIGSNPYGTGVYNPMINGNIYGPNNNLFSCIAAPCNPGAGAYLNANANVPGLYANGYYGPGNPSFNYSANGLLNPYTQGGSYYNLTGGPNSNPYLYNQNYNQFNNQYNNQFQRNAQQSAAVQGRNMAAYQGTAVAQASLQQSANQRIQDLYRVGNPIYGAGVGAQYGSCPYQALSMCSGASWGTGFQGSAGFNFNIGAGGNPCGAAGIAPYGSCF